MLRWLRMHSLPYLPVVLLPLILFSVPLFGGRALYWGIPGLQFIPWRAYAWDTLRQGALPLWNALNGMGAPLAANYQLALFYPPGWIVYLFAALGGTPWMAWSHTLLVALHLILAGWGMARLARSFGLGTLAQTVSALSFSLGGFIVARAGFFSMVWTAAWLPWVLLAAGQIAAPGKAYRPVKRLFPLSLPVFLALMLLAGHAQWSWYTLLLAAAWVFVGGWSGAGFQRGLTALLRFGAAALLAVLLSAVQLLPTAQYLLLSQRSSSLDYNTLMSYSFWPWRFITLIAPDFFGNPGYGDYWGYANYWEDAIYIGMLPFLLAVSTLRFVGRKPFLQVHLQGKQTLVRFLWILVGVSFLLALGKNTPVFQFLYKNAPTFDLFNAPSRYLIWAGFALPLLAGIGVETWQTPQGRGLYWMRLATAGGFAVTLGAFAGWYFLGGVSPSFIRATALTGVWALGTGLLTLFMPEPSRDADLPPAPFLKEGGKERKLFPPSFRKGAGGRSESRGGPKRKFRFGPKAWEPELAREKPTLRMSAHWAKSWPVLVVLWLSCDLLLANWALNPSVKSSFYAQSLPQPRSVLTTGARVYLSYTDDYDLKYRRFLRFSDFRPIEDLSDIREVGLPNLNLLDGTTSANNFDPMVPERYANWMAMVDDLPAEQRGPLLALMNVDRQEIMDVNEPLGVRFEPVAGAARFRWYACMEPAAGPADALQKTSALTAGGLPDKLVVEAPAKAKDGWKPCDPGGSDAQVTVMEEGPSLLRLRINATGSGWLMVADSYDPGWQAALSDGSASKPQAATIYPADYAFRAVYVPEGETILEMRYRPVVFTWGAWISLIAWLFILISIIIK